MSFVIAVKDSADSSFKPSSIKNNIWSIQGSPLANNRRASSGKYGK